MKNQIIFFVLFYSSQSFAQNNTSEEKEEVKPYIEVTGTAEKQVNPDEIFIKFFIQEKFDKGEKVTLEEQENKLKSGLTSLNIPISDLSITDADLDYTRIHIFKKDVLTSKDYILKLSNVKAIENTFLLFQNIDIKNAYISRVSHSRIDSIKREVRILAIKAAKEKATYLIEAIGEKLGKPIYITENSTSQNYNPNQLNIAGGRAESNVYFIDGVKVQGQSTNETVQFQKIKVQASYYIKYAIQ